MEFIHSFDKNVVQLRSSYKPLSRYYPRKRNYFSNHFVISTCTGHKAGLKTSFADVHNPALVTSVMPSSMEFELKIVASYHIFKLDYFPEYDVWVLR